MDWFTRITEGANLVWTFAIAALSFLVLNVVREALRFMWPEPTNRYPWGNPRYPMCLRRRY